MGWMRSYGAVYIWRQKNKGAADKSSRKNATCRRIFNETILVMDQQIVIIETSTIHFRFVIAGRGSSTVHPTDKQASVNIWIR